MRCFLLLLLSAVCLVNTPLKSSQVADVDLLKQEFDSLQDLSRQEAHRHRPLIADIDDEASFTPFYENKITLVNGTEVSASYIHLMEDEIGSNFIAAQAPMKTNVDIFWQMIWEQEVNQIVMVTELSEENEPDLCYPYLPERMGEALVFNKNITVNQVDEKCLLPELHENIEVRTLRVKRGEKERNVTHYWYRHWPDNTAPVDPTTILTLIRTVQEDKNQLKIDNPILVHCAWGIGRTGVFITLYHAVQTANRGEDPTPLFEFVAYLRKQRPLIGNFEQYLFCHRVQQSLHAKNGLFLSELASSLEHQATSVTNNL